MTETDSEEPQVGAASVVVRKRLVRGVAASFLQNGITLAITLVTTPLYVRFLGKEFYGLWAAAYSLVAYLSLAGLGIPQAAANRIAESYAQKRFQEAADVLVTSAWAMGVLAAAASLVVVFLLYAGVLSQDMIRGSEAMQRDAIPLLVITFAGYLIATPFEQFRGALRAVQRVDLEQVFLTARGAVGLVAGAIVLLAGGDVLGLALSQSIVLIVSGAVAIAMVIRAHPEMPLRPFGAKKNVARELLTPGVHFFLVSLGGAFIWSSSNLIIASYLDAASVTPFSVSMRLLTFGIGWIALGTSAIMPAATVLWSTRDEGRLRRMVLTVLRYTCAGMALFGVECAFYGREFIGLWVGPDVVSEQSVFLVLLALMMIRAFAMCFEYVLLATSTHRTYAYITLAEGILNVTLSIALVRHFGVLGAAIGIFVAHVSCAGTYLPWRGARLAGVRAADIIRESIMPVLLPALVASALAIGMRQVLPRATWMFWLLRTAAVAISFITVYVMTALTASERRDLWARWTRLRRRGSSLP